MKIYENRTDLCKDEPVFWNKYKARKYAEVELKSEHFHGDSLINACQATGETSAEI